MIQARTILILSTMVGFSGFALLFRGDTTAATLLLAAGSFGCIWVSWVLK